MKSSLTRAEHNAAAMLMGKSYDWRDHTYCDKEPTQDDVMLDADTFEVVPWGKGNLRVRRQRVQNGEIGCADGPFKFVEA